MAKKSGGAAPDPYATAQAQGTVNADTARLQAALNRGNTYTPFGSVTNTNAGAEWFDAEVKRRMANGEDEASARTAAGSDPRRDQWNTTVSLSPEQQRLYDQGIQLDTGANQIALDMLPQARTALMEPMALDDADARNRATAGIMSRLNPQFERDRAALDSRLVAQGFTPGTEAYRQAADELNRTMTDARLQADAYGLDASQKAAGFANQTRAQRINELAMLFGLGPGMQMPAAAQNGQVGVNAPDLMGNIYNNYRTQVQQAGADNAAMAGLGGAAIGAIGVAI